jgi:hypothetical protein
MNRLWKWTRSFFLREWTFADYPVRVLKVEHSARPGLSLPPPWTAQLEGWWQMAGFGDSREQALKQLVARFDEHVYHGHPLPRPGADVPIILGTYQDELMAHEEQEEIKQSNG